MKIETILRGTEEFNRLLDLPGWKNQKGESVTKEDILARKSALKIRVFDKCYDIFLTSGYWFELNK